MLSQKIIGESEVDVWSSSNGVEVESVCGVWYVGWRVMWMVRRKHIKFTPCPVGRHKGERWSKLEKLDVSKPVRLIGVETAWNYEFFEEGVRFKVDGSGTYNVFTVDDDTFENFDEQDWIDLMMLFYGRETVFGIVLLFSQDCEPYWDEGLEEEFNDRWFTTFRAYDVRKHTYYEKNIGEEFYIKETDQKKDEAQTKLGEVD